MKAREPDIKVKRWIAMLQAADLIEREGSYEYSETEMPRSCQDAGCVLGWIGFAAKIDPQRNIDQYTPVGRVAVWLGYNPTDNYPASRFYDDMDRVCGNSFWISDSVRAANAVRRLAEEMTT